MNSPSRLCRLAGRASRRSERGQTLVLVALAAIGLIAMVALGIDLIRLYDARSEAQNAADHAATTASHAVCRLGKTPADAMTDGYTVALENGFEQAGAATTVAITHNSGTKFTVVATQTIDTSFAAVIGVFTLDASATAVGDCTAAGGGGIPGAIFGGGDDCIKDINSEFALRADGSNIKIYGGVRVNSDVNFGGSNFEWRLTGTPPDPDPVEYRGIAYPNASPATHIFDTGYPDDIDADIPPPLWPPGWEPDVAEPYSSNDAYWAAWSAKASADGNGGLTSSFIESLPRNGVYYTDHVNGIKISSVDPTVTNFTLVARNGPVIIASGLDGREFSPDPDALNIIALSGHIRADGQSDEAQKKCSEATVELSASNTTLNGVMWAPGGQVVWGGSNNKAKGGLIGWSVRTNGSNHVINFDGSGFAGNPEVLLLE